MKCKYSKKCKYYQEDSVTCNTKQTKEDGIYCGKYRSKNEKKK